MSEIDSVRITLSERQLHDLELIVDGGFAPLAGFLNQEDYESVVSRSRLKDGTLWPIPIILDVDASSVPKIGSEILLDDIQGNTLAHMMVESVFVPDKKKEALNVYGTLDNEHPGVEYLFNQTKNTYIGGSIRGLKKQFHQDFEYIRKTPHDLKKFFKAKNAKNILAFQTRNPIHRAHYELITRAAEKYNAHILIHPAVGPTKAGDIDYVTRVRSYEKLIAARIPYATLALLPLAMRMAGPREALWHAIIRKNYGATHFIVGRDHAGPGKNSQGVSFYTPYEAQNFAAKFADEIGITVVPSPELAYDEHTKTYIDPEQINSESKIVSISGTEFRRRLRTGELIPEWFSFPEVIGELRRAQE